MTTLPPQKAGGAKKKYFEVREAIFDRPVHIFAGFSGGDLAAKVQEKGLHFYVEGMVNFSAFSLETSNPNAPTEWAIVLKHFDGEIEAQASLLHEVVHTIVKIFAANSIPCNLDTQEFLALDVEELYTDISTELAPKRNKSVPPKGRTVRR